MKRLVAVCAALIAGWSLCLADATVPPPSPTDGGTSPQPPAGVACATVADCWLDDNGAAIKRPRRFRGKPLPRGDCGGRLLWLRNRLSCEEKRCVAVHVGDRC